MIKKPVLMAILQKIVEGDLSSRANFFDTPATYIEGGQSARIEPNDAKTLLLSYLLCASQLDDNDTYFTFTHALKNTTLESLLHPFIGDKFPYTGNTTEAIKEHRELLKEGLVTLLGNTEEASLMAFFLEIPFIPLLEKETWLNDIADTQAHEVDLEDHLENFFNIFLGRERHTQAEERPSAQQRPATYSY